MNRELKFLEQMNNIASYGQEHGGKVSREDVENELNGTTLSNVQWEALGEFLYGKKVLLDGYTPKEEQQPAYEFTTEEKKFMGYYEEDIASIPRKTKEELEEMLLSLKNGKEDLNTVYNLLLPHIYNVAKSYANGKEHVGDLVQEANLQVYTILSGIKDWEEGSLYKKMNDEIEMTIKSMLSLEDDEKVENERIVAKLNQLLNAVEVLKEQNAMYTVEDLSEFLDISVNEIENLLRIAGQESGEDTDK